MSDPTDALPEAMQDAVVPEADVTLDLGGGKAALLAALESLAAQLIAPHLGIETEGTVVTVDLAKLFDHFLGKKP